MKKVFSLGKQPLANQFGEGNKRYPLVLMQCQHCTLLQLSYVVPMNKMYDEYFYIPSVSKTYLKHFSNLADTLAKNLQLKKDSFVVDVGGNDGSLLKFFEKKGMHVLNIDPARNITSSVPVMQEYFTPEVALQAVNKYGKAKLIIATNSFAHINDFTEYLHALDILLDDDGVFFAQFPDVRNLLRENQFDTIYHEHLSYLTYEPLHHLFANSPFELWQITSDNIHGGSMQIWVKRRKPLLTDFVRNVGYITQNLKEIVGDYQQKGNKVVGFGAAAKGTVLLNHTKLKLDYVVDGTPYKQEKNVPGTKIPIYPEKYLLEDSPDVVLILAWNFKAEIMKKLKGRGYTFIIPIPEVQIIPS